LPTLEATVAVNTDVSAEIVREVADITKVFIVTSSLT